VPPDGLVERLLRLPTVESGTPVEWADGSGILGKITKLAAFSWCFFLEVQLEIPARGSHKSIVWLPGALSDAVEVRVWGEDGYELASGRPRAEQSGVLLIGSEGRPIREQGVVVRHWAKGRYWCWPLPPDSPLTASLALPAADIDEVIGTFSGESLNRGARRSLPLDPDMRHPPDN
jgi:hypothetical protein